MPTTEYIEIPLTQGQFTRVSAHRREEVLAHKYFAKWNEKAKAFYAARNIKVRVGRGGQRIVWLHRELLGLTPDDPREGDHRDRNPLNNVDENLRIATRRQNVCNQGLRKDNKTGYKGVGIRHGKLRVRIRINGKLIHLGAFPLGQEREAALAYDAAAIRYFGEFAHLNFPKDS